MEKDIPSGWGPDLTYSPWVSFAKAGYFPGPGAKGYAGGTDRSSRSLVDLLTRTELMSSKWDNRKILLYKDGELPRGVSSDIIPLDKPVGYVVFAGE